MYTVFDTGDPKATLLYIMCIYTRFAKTTLDMRRMNHLLLTVFLSIDVGTSSSEFGCELLWTRLQWSEGVVARATRRTSVFDMLSSPQEQVLGAPSRIIMALFRLRTLYLPKKVEGLTDSSGKKSFGKKPSSICMEQFLKQRPMRYINCNLYRFPVIIQLMRGSQ